MTGRELIIYILENELENVDLFKDGNFKLPGFVSVEEAAVKFNTGIETVKLWYELGFVKGLYIGKCLYIKEKREERT